MNAVVAERPGRLSDALDITSIYHSAPLGEGEVDVRMLGSTVNPSDAVSVSGAYGSRTTFPFIPGFEGVGVIERVGPGVPESVIGSRVLPIGSAGNRQEMKRTHHSWCIPVPDDIPDAVACFAYINPLTAFLMVQRYCTASTRHVVVTAASSTIAGHLADLLVDRGITSIGLTRGTPGSTVTDPNFWGSIIDTSDPRWPEQLRAATGGMGAGVIFDCVGGGQGAELMQLLAPGGVLAHYGLLSGESLPLECFAREDGRRVEMFRLRDIVHAHPRGLLAELFDPVFAHLRAGRLNTSVTRRIALTALPEVLRHDSTDRRGKIMITYDS